MHAHLRAIPQNRSYRDAPVAIFESGFTGRFLLKIDLIWVSDK